MSFLATDCIFSHIFASKDLIFPIFQFIINSKEILSEFTILFKIFFQALIDVNQGLLSSLGVSHPKLEQIIGITAKHGLHSKLTGAGGGGFAFALISPFHKEKSVQNAKLELENNEFQSWDTNLAGEGVKISCKME